MMIESVQMQHHLHLPLVNARYEKWIKKTRKRTGTKMIFVLSRLTVLFDLSICDAQRNRERESENGRQREGGKYTTNWASCHNRRSMAGWLTGHTKHLGKARANNMNTIQMKITPYCYKSQTDILVIIICIIIIINCGGPLGAHRCRSSRMRANNCAGEHQPSGVNAMVLGKAKCNHY